MTSALMNRIFLAHQPTSFKPEQPISGSSSLLRHPIAVIPRSGILTGFPSTTHFCLALGADSPCSDERRAGNLRFSARGTFTPFVVTHVSIRSSDTSSNLLKSPSLAYRMLPYRVILMYDTRSFGGWFKPRYIFRAGRLDQ